MDYVMILQETKMKVHLILHKNCSIFRRCHEKTSYVSNYAFFTLLYKWVDRGQRHRFEKLQEYTSSDEIRITHTEVFLIDASALYRPIHAIKV